MYNIRPHIDRDTNANVHVHMAHNGRSEPAYEIFDEENPSKLLPGIWSKSTAEELMQWWNRGPVTREQGSKDAGNSTDSGMVRVNSEAEGKAEIPRTTEA